jgi:hypothetical protein
MKYLIIIGIVAACALLAGCGKKATIATAKDHAVFTKMQHDVSTSRVVCYAIVNTSKTTNVVFTITEIWKGSEDGVALGITNGMQIHSHFPGEVGHPDGAILLFPQNANPSAPRGVIYVRQGRVLDMTIQEFKTKIGL